MTDTTRGTRQPFETSYESSHGYGYGQQARDDTGTGTGTGTETEQPSLRERLESAFTGRTPEQQAEYDRTQQSSRAGTGTGTGSLAESMRSSRPSLESGTTSYESREQPSTGEKMKSLVSGRTAQEEHEYQRQQQQQRAGGATYGTGTGYGTGYGTTSRQEQPTFVERVEATFTGRTPQEQHDYHAQERRQREMERSRGGSTSSSEPGLMSAFGSMMGSTLGSTTPQRRGSFKEKMKQSIDEIRTSLTGTSGDTTYGSSMESHGSYPRTSTESRQHIRTSGSTY